MSDKSIENITTTNQNFAPTLINSYPLPDAKFNGHCLINKSPDSGKVINLYNSLYNCLFGSVD